MNNDSSFSVTSYLTANPTGDGRFQPEGPTVADWLDTDLGKEFIRLFWWELNNVGDSEIGTTCWETVFGDAPAYYVPKLLLDSPWMYEQFQKYVITDFTKASLFQETLITKLSKELNDVLKDFCAKEELYKLEKVVLDHPKCFNSEVNVGGTK